MKDLVKNAKYMREYTEKNREKINAQRRERRKANLEHCKAVARKWYAENLDKVKKWNIRIDPVKAKARQARWDKKNYDKVLQKARNYQARRRNAKGSITAKEWRDLCDKYGNKCLKCGRQGKVTLDHVVPLSLGGENSIENAQPLCHPCNSGKRDKTVDYRKD